MRTETSKTRIPGKTASVKIHQTFLVSAYPIADSCTSGTRSGARPRLNHPRLAATIRVRTDTGSRSAAPCLSVFLLAFSRLAFL